MSITVKIKPRKDFVKKDSHTALYLWITIDRKTKLYKLDHYIPFDKWDWNNNCAKGKNDYAFHVNSYISSKLSEANIIFLSMQSKGIAATFEAFENLYFNKQVRNYYDYAQSYINTNNGKFSFEYLKQLKTELSKMQKFRKQVFIQDINHKFLSEYEFYMRNTLNNSTNTIHKSLKIVRTIINEAMRQDENILSRSPFFTYKLKTEPSQRTYLTYDEFELLFSMKDVFSEKISNVLNYFLFSCLTGLRFQDIRNLRHKNIHDNHIELVMHKTKTSIIIPLVEKAKMLIPHSDNQNDYVFNVLTNQKTNDYLKLAIEKAEIEKDVSFHCGRHTFATMALNFGIPIEVVQKLMGHTKIATTQIYGKIVNKTIFEQMKKMEK